MKLNTLYIVALAALASVDAAPLPIDNESPQLARSLRFGHGVPPLAVRDVPQFDHIKGPAVSVSSPTRLPCFMRKLAAGGITITNTFRKAIGLPVIESPVAIENHHSPSGKGPAYSILPFIGTPPTYVESKNSGEGDIVIYNKYGEAVRIFGPGGMEIDHPDHPGHPDHHPHPPHHPQHGHHGHHKHHGNKHHRLFRLCRHSSFLRRLTFALMSLGKWEGRAVAFVLGCGLGVLLRMLWVLSVITYRTIKGNRRDEVEYTVIHEYIDAEEIPAPPPTYTYVDVDEKADAKKDEETPTVAA